MVDARGSWGPISDAILGSISSQARQFYDTNQNVKALLTDRSKRLATLAVDFVKASDEDRPAIRRNMDIVRQTLANEVAALAVEASAEAKASFASVVDAVFQAATKVLPGVLGAL